MSPLKIPILMYHEVIEENQVDAISQKIAPSWVVQKDDFEKQIVFLKDNGYETICLDRLVDFIDGKTDREEFPLNPILITFDDGFAGNYQYGFPILQRYGMVATIFVTVNDIGTKFMLSWNQLKEMNKYNMSIQSHTLTHPLLSGLDFHETKNEIVVSRQIIEDSIGAKVDYISLPNGDYNKHYFGIVKKYGFRGGCSSIYGFNKQGTNRFLLRRIDVRKKHDISQFRELLNCKSMLTKLMLSKSLLKRGLTRAMSKKYYDRAYRIYRYGVKSNNGQSER